jgi:hypothetical protein
MIVYLTIMDFTFNFIFRLTYLGSRQVSNVMRSESEIKRRRYCISRQIIPPLVAQLLAHLVRFLKMKVERKMRKRTGWIETYDFSRRYTLGHYHSLGE